MGLVGDALKRFMSHQALFYKQLPSKGKEKLAEVENKYAELRVTGPEGGLFYLQFKNRMLQLIDGKPDVPYEKMDKFLLDGDGINYPSGDEVFFDIIDGDLAPRAVYDRHYFRANTDRILYDPEEFIQAFEYFLREMRKVLRIKKSTTH